MNKQRIWLAMWLITALAGAAAAGCNSTAGSEDSDGATPASKSDSDAGEQDGEQDGEEGADGKADGEKGDEDKDGKDGDKKKEEAVPVEVYALARGPIESVLRFSSNLEAERQVQVIAEASRRITSLLVEEGDRVRRGQVLVRLQSDAQESMLARSQSEYDEAAREYDRQERLWDQKLISEEAYNNATFELDRLKLALDDAKRELGYTEVRAPIGGTITQRMVNLGDHINVGEHLFDIVDFDSIVARVFVPEAKLATLREGLPVRINANAARAEAYEGRIERIAPIVDPRTGTIKVTVLVGRQPGLRPGMYVDVDLVTATRQDAILVPKRALIYDNDQIFVFRLGEGEERRVERILVQPLLTDKFNVLPTDGLDEGDQIVVAGQAGLKDGALVSLPGDETEAAGESDDDSVRAAL